MGNPIFFMMNSHLQQGLPHHGHLVGSILKDIIPRYFTMKGRYVERRFGWDCHGLPIEHEIDKQLGMSAQDAVKKLGIKNTTTSAVELFNVLRVNGKKQFQELDVG